MGIFWRELGASLRLSASRVLDVVIGGKPVASANPADGQALVYDAGTETWGPGTVETALSDATPHALGSAAAGTASAASRADHVHAMPSAADVGAVATSLLTTRGDIVTRGASAPQRLAVGSSGKVLGSDGTDPAWVTPTVAASGITDATSAGRAVLTAADASAQRTALGLGALATASSITASQISDGGTTGRALVQKATIADVHALLGSPLPDISGSLGTDLVYAVSFDGLSSAAIANGASVGTVIAGALSQPVATGTHMCSRPRGGVVKEPGYATDRLTTTGFSLDIRSGGNVTAISIAVIFRPWPQQGDAHNSGRSAIVSLKSADSASPACALDLGIDSSGQPYQLTRIGSSDNVDNFAVVRTAAGNRTVLVGVWALADASNVFAWSAMNGQFNYYKGSLTRSSFATLTTLDLLSACTRDASGGGAIEAVYVWSRSLIATSVAEQALIGGYA